MSTKRRTWTLERITSNFVVYTTKLDDPNKVGVVYIPRSVFAPTMGLSEHYPQTLDLITGSKPQYTKLSASSVSSIAKTLERKKQIATQDGFPQRAAAFEEAMSLIEQYGRIEA